MPEAGFRNLAERTINRPDRVDCGLLTEIISSPTPEEDAAHELAKELSKSILRMLSPMLPSVFGRIYATTGRVKWQNLMNATRSNLDFVRSQM